MSDFMKQKVSEKHKVFQENEKVINENTKIVTKKKLE